MPKPTDTESRQEFMQRCMSDSESMRTFGETEQRYAFCSSQWDNNSKKQLKENPYRDEYGRFTTEDNDVGGSGGNGTLDTPTLNVIDDGFGQKVPVDSNGKQISRFETGVMAGEDAKNAIAKEANKIVRESGLSQIHIGVSKSMSATGEISVNATLYGFNENSEDNAAAYKAIDDSLNRVKTDLEKKYDKVYKGIEVRIPWRGTIKIKMKT